MSYGKPSNVAILTQENKIWSAKKRQKKAQVKEVVFDENARRDFLTGFRKRKLARQEAGKAKAIEKERLSRLEARREKRKELAERAAQNVKAAERAYAGDYDSDQSNASTSLRKPVDPEEMEFENEEQVATVTVVEDFDASDLKMLSIGNAPLKDASAPRRDRDTHPKPKPKDTKVSNARNPVNKKAKFRYETKPARKHEKMKQRARRDEKGQRSKRHKVYHCKRCDTTSCLTTRYGQKCQIRVH